MSGSNTKVLPYYEPVNDANVIDLPIQEPRQIVLLEREYLELKCAVGYWQKMHQKAVLRENELKQIIKEQEGKIRDLQGRLFGKKSETGKPSKNEGQKESQPSTRPRGQGVKDMGVLSDLTFRRETKKLPFQHLQYVRNVVRLMCLMKARKPKFMKLRSKPISVELYAAA